jgi:hypothetical protein
MGLSNDLITDITRKAIEIRLQIIENKIVEYCDKNKTDEKDFVSKAKIVETLGFNFRTVDIYSGSLHIIRFKLYNDGRIKEVKA